MTATYSSFVNAICGMNVAGVTRLTAPPTALNTADLPASFPMLPSGNQEQLVFANSAAVGGGQHSYSCDLIFAFEPIAQGTQAQNFSGLLALMDKIIAASKTLVRPTAGPMTFALRMGTISIGDISYWAVYETWTGVG